MIITFIIKLIMMSLNIANTFDTNLTGNTRFYADDILIIYFVMRDILSLIFMFSASNGRINGRKKNIYVDITMKKETILVNKARGIHF